jgi:superfamily II DNA or RNA helicase
LPRIFDNIDLRLLPALTDTLKISHRADFCVGYFNLRGWKLVDEFIGAWQGGDGACCRLIVGMSSMPQDELRKTFSLANTPDELDAQAAQRLRKRVAEEFRSQLVLGAPNNTDEAGLRRLSAQLKAKKIVVKLFLRHWLHAKLYLIHRTDPNNPSTGFLGSSNLTFPGLSKQGELNVDVLDQDACKKLQKWFEDRWNDQWCIDITNELVEILDTSWARPEILPPYHIYLKMAYHLSQEARAGLSEFHVPRDFGNKLLAFQTAAVKIAAQYLNKRGGVVIGDVVGLGKTLMSVALARIFQDDHGTETLIICPKNLVRMWEDYVHQYRMAAKIVPLSTAMRDLPELPRYRVVLIDESHNLRNREGKRYKVIKEYIEKNSSKCILLSATPYNKSYIDLSSQLQLFIAGDQDLGIRPERYIKEIGETEFIRRHQAPVRSLAAFEKSDYPDDWRDLMRLYLVRRTRGFIKDNYSKLDEQTGRKYLTFDTGERFYFPDRLPKTVKFDFREDDPNDPYARLYSSDVVNAINGLSLPRYGLGNYIAASPHRPPTDAEAKELVKLSRAGKRLMGFCRTNLFKRLESGGPAFIQSLERHALRNFVYLYAIDAKLPVPIGAQGAELLDAKIGDQDLDNLLTDVDEEQESSTDATDDAAFLRDERAFRKRAEDVYKRYSTELKKRFKWLGPTVFVDALRQDLLDDSLSVLRVINKCGVWDAAKDAKLNALVKLLTKKYRDEKVLVFTQFADTAKYLSDQLKHRGISHLESVTGEDENPTNIAWLFSPESNKKRDVVKPEHELRVLIATDVLSEGQNLQDCHVIVNYDLPWAIIRLIQRAGRVDRIGQKSDTIYCYSFMPADGVEQIINLRRRVRQRLRENAEVVGSDESFFEGDTNDQPVIDLYNENSGVLEEHDAEVDLASYAYQIWKNAIDRNPKLQKTIADLPSVVYSSKAHQPTTDQPTGVLMYMRTADGNDALAWIDGEGKSVTQSQLSILRAAECFPDTPALPRQERHHELVEAGVRHLVQEEKSIGGQLGRPSGARFRVYERLKSYSAHVQGTLFATQELAKAIDEVYRYPLQQSAADTLNRQLRSVITDQQLADLVVSLRAEARLCRIEEEVETQEPQIICSLGLSSRDVAR